ncbi:AraC family ligand binding domain-containing protein [Phenylobacterium sp.]|uniref:AraC family ligand binding domain-containing protein n=1 Tax=Phenylobacterium sp. TaxID=1871053 RepID=UPI002BB6ABD8|nr:AraC family ligand binding domain-containing protein [Phenylobacterium sp.]HLZ73617.1 AraC family ligand binding domain-containing protein [Phenylobacterium sp.]
MTHARLWLAGLLVTTAAAAAAAAETGRGVYVSAAQIAALVAKTKDGVATAPVPAGPGTTMLAAHRTADGQVEVHLKLNDEFVVQSGHATVLVGGKVEGNKEAAPGEWRGGKVTGAKAYQLGPGDVLWIPAGAPHQTLVPKGGDFRYLAFKFDAK